MTCANENLHKDKISPGFKARLDRLGPQQKVRVIILLRTQGAGKATGRRRLHEDRQMAVEAIRKSAEQALMDIDSILNVLVDSDYQQLPTRWVPYPSKPPLPASLHLLPLSTSRPFLRIKR
jgi:hypothetical protein